MARTAPTLARLRNPMNWIVQCCKPRNPSRLVHRLLEQGAGRVYLVWDEPRRGNFYTARDAFRLAAKLGGPTTVLQDDVWTCLAFVPYVNWTFEECGYDDCGVIQWYVPGGTVRRDTRTHLQMMPSDGFVMAQATSYDEWSVRRLADWFNTATPQKDDRGLVHGDDVYIRDWLVHAREPYSIHFPGLVQHLAPTTSVTAGPDALGPNIADRRRTSDCYVGDYRNVMTAEPL